MRFALAFGLAWLATEPPSAAAEAALARATENYAAGRYAEAAEALRTLNELDPRPEYVFSLAQAERESGDCAAAIDHYQEFLRSNPAPVDAEEANAKLSYCESVVEKEPVPPPAAVTPAGIPGAVDSTELVAVSRPRPWHRDPAGGVLVGLGAPMTAIGAGLLGTALAQRRDAGEASTEQDFDKTDRSVQRTGTAGIVVLSVGVTTLVAGVVRWALVARRNRLNKAR